MTNYNQITRDKWIEEKSKETPEGSTVLDVGAGTCPYRDLFKHCIYTTQDFKKSDVSYGKIDIISDITDIPVKDNSYDYILCTEVLEHVPEPIKAFKEMVRIGKKLIITAPLGSGLHQTPYHYYGGFTPYFYEMIAKKFNLKIVEIESNGGFFKLLAQEIQRAGNYLRQDYSELIKIYMNLDIDMFIKDFTIGYHIVMEKQ